MRRHAAGTTACVVLALALGSGRGPVRAASDGIHGIRTSDLREWLSYIASDELEGRGTYSAGLGLAAGYIQEHLRAWGVKPAGDAGSYVQTARVLDVKVASRSAVTVRVGTETRVFKDGEGVAFPRFQGRARAVTVGRVQFAGYGLHAPLLGSEDFRGLNVRDHGVVFLGPTGPQAVDSQRYRRVLSSRSRHAVDQLGAAASIGPQAQTPPVPQADSTSDFTTAQRLDAVVEPSITASDEFFRFLFSKAPTSYDELKRRADAREPLAAFALDGVTLTFDIAADYTVVRTRLTQNVVGVVEGRDQGRRSSYVAFGAHYDHVGYADGETTDEGRSRPSAPGRVTPGAVTDRIWNGADDDGSGTVALMALAKAFAQGPRPRRSLLFVWHAGEERGLLGSRYFADHPTVPIDSVVAQLNLDMIGRNRDDKADEANTVYLVGSDRISSELHDLNRVANASLPKPLTLSYDMNDPADVEQVYYRSDHYSYAAKGIPIIFFTTGLHPDYHANTDHVSKIEFDKMTRVVQLAYETGARLANLEKPPARDRLGPRAGQASQ